MKYSYMLLKDFKGKAYVPFQGHDFFIDSDERLLGFRNQYGEHFIFTSKRGARMVSIVAFIVGLIIGKFVL